MIRTSLLVCAALLACCTPAPSPAPPSPDAGDAGPGCHLPSAGAPSSDCVAACAHLHDPPPQGLGCAWAASSPDGCSCEAWCTYYAARPLPIRPACLLRATSCEAARTGCGG